MFTMASVKRTRRGKQTLRNRIHNYISKKQDVCCEENVDRKLLIEQIFEKYKLVSKYLNEPNEYLSYINNDIILFIGYKIRLIQDNDFEGVHIWDELDRKMYKHTTTNKGHKNNVLEEGKMKALLLEVPFYFLLAFLGYASYRENTSKGV